MSRSIHSFQTSLQIAGRSRVRRIFLNLMTVTVTTEIRSVPDDNYFATKMIDSEKQGLLINSMYSGIHLDNFSRLNRLKVVFVKAAAIVPLRSSRLLESLWKSALSSNPSHKTDDNIRVNAELSLSCIYILLYTQQPCTERVKLYQITPVSQCIGNICVHLSTCHLSTCYG